MIHTLTLTSVRYDDATGDVTFVLAGQRVSAPVDLPDGAAWYPDQQRIDITARMPKGVFKAQTGIAVVVEGRAEDLSKGGGLRIRRYRLTVDASGVTTSSVEVDAAGNPV